MSSIYYGSRVVNGQLVPVLEWRALASGNAVGPAWGGGPASPATIPPNAGSMASGAGGGGPFSFSKSPLPLLLIMLVIGILGLRYIHWRKS